MERCGLVIETGGFQVIVDKDLKSGRHRSELGQKIKGSGVFILALVTTAIC